MKWGIMATGTIAAKFAKTVALMNSAEEAVVAVGSRDEKRAKAFADTYGIKKAYGSYEELVSDSEVEAVYIATPNSLHMENAMLCLENGKHVLCEKPFTTNAADAEFLYNEAEKRGLFIMEAFWIRFLPLYRELMDIVGTKKFGDLRHVRCDYGYSVNETRRERKFRSDLGGGALLDIGIYNLGFLHMLMGAAPEKISTEVHFNEYGTDDFSILQLKYPEGRTAQCAQSIGIRMERRAAVYFDRAAVYLPDFQAATTMTVKPDGGEAYTVECPFDINGFEYEIRETTKCIKEKKTHSDIFTPHDSLAVLGLMDKIRDIWNMKFSFE